jgi:hypothetical protein
MLGAQEDIGVVGEASDGGEAVEQTLRRRPERTRMELGGGVPRRVTAAG